MIVLREQLSVKRRQPTAPLKPKPGLSGPPARGSAEAGWISQSFNSLILHVLLLIDASMLFVGSY